MSLAAASIRLISTFFGAGADPSSGGGGGGGQRRRDVFQPEAACQFGIGQRGIPKLARTITETAPPTSREANTRRMFIRSIGSLSSSGSSRG